MVELHVGVVVVVVIVMRSATWNMRWSWFSQHLLYLVSSEGSLYVLFW